MKKNIKKKWLKALRTPVAEGGYIQTTGVLHDRRANGTDRFCALGVLANVMNLNGGCDGYDAFTYFSGGQANQHTGLTHDDVTAVIGWNDANLYTFAQIADLIEEKF